MKNKKHIVVFLFLVLALLLTSCSGRMLSASSWPGITGNDEAVFITYANRIYSLRLKDGSLNWQYPEETSPTLTFFAKPLLADDQVYFGDYVHSFYALDANTGAEQWKFDEAGGRYIGGALAVDDLIIAPNSDHSLYALNKNGVEQWSFETGHALWSTPLSDGELVFVASMDHSVYALDKESGTQVWKSDLGGSIIYSPTLTEGGVIVAATVNKVVALDAADGSEVWSFDVPDQLWSEPVENDGVIYFGNAVGRIYALDAENGSLVWDYNISQLVAGAAAIIDDGVVFASEEGKVLALDFNGELLWTRQIEGKVYTGPVVADGMLVLGAVDADTLITAFDYEGTVIWEFTPEK